MKVAFYDTKPYDRASFEPLGEANQIRFKFFEDKLTEDTARERRGLRVRQRQRKRGGH